MNYIDIPAGMETAAFAMGAGALNELADFVAKVFPGKKPWIIADENTFAAAGKKASACRRFRCYQRHRQTRRRSRQCALLLCSNRLKC